MLIEGIKAIHPFDEYDIIIADSTRYKDTGEFVNVELAPERFARYPIHLIDGVPRVLTSLCDFESKSFPDYQKQV